MAPPASLSSLVISSPTLSSPTASRLQSLYTFTSAQSASNPEGYNSNVEWWSRVIEEGLTEGYFGDRLFIDLAGEAFVKKLEWQGLGRPRGVGGIVKCLLPPASPAVLLPHNHFLSSPTSPLAPPSIASRFIARPLWWALNQVNPFASDPAASVESEDRIWSRLVKQKFVHLTVLEQAASSILSYLSENPPPTPSTRLFTLPTFRTTYSRHCFPDGEMLSEADCEVLLVYLRRDKGELVNDATGKIFKLVDPMTAATNGVTEADVGMISILTTLSTLDIQTASLSTEITAAQEKAAKHLRLSQKSVALSYLRSKKQLESILERRVAAAEQLRTVLRSIDSAHGDVEIMAAYETSTHALRNLLKHPSLQVSHIDKVTLELSDALADQKEISDAITTGGQMAVSAGSSGIEIDETDLEEELRVLVEKEQAEREEEQKEKGEQEKEKEAAKQIQDAKTREEEGKRLESLPHQHALPVKDTTSKLESPPIAAAPTTSRRAQLDRAAIDAAAEERDREEKIRAGVERLAIEEQQIEAE